MRFSSGRFAAFLLLFSFGLAVMAQDRYTNKLAPYVASPSRVIDVMLDLARIKPGETVFDLGSGDGRILIAAAERGAKVVGVEISPALVQTANDELKKAGVADRAKVIQGDATKTDLTGANVVTLYLSTEGNALVRPQLEKYLKAGARVVSYDYEIPGWTPTRVEKMQETRSHTIYLYEIK